MRGGLQTGFQPVACSLCADGVRRYSARINAFILLPLYYSGAVQGSQGTTKNDSECPPRCFGHIQRKNYFKFRDSRTPAGVPLSHFHSRGHKGKPPVNRYAPPCEKVVPKRPQAFRNCNTKYSFRSLCPKCNDDDRRQRRKQGGVVGAAASKTQVPPKARCGCWVPQPNSGAHSNRFSQNSATAARRTSKAHSHATAHWFTTMMTAHLLPSSRLTEATAAMQGV